MKFNWRVYRALNPDLRRAGLFNKDQLDNHYELHGKNERRKISIYQVYPDFNVENYRYNYEDIENKSDEELEEHYLVCGIKEGRIYHRRINRVYIIYNIEKGGTVKYLQDLERGFPKNRYLYIKNKKRLYDITFRDTDIVLLQQLLHTKIPIKDILELKKKYKFRLILSIHDFYWLNTNLKQDYKVNPHSRYLETKEMLPEVKELIEICDIVIHPSRFTYDQYSRYCSNKNFVVVPHNDAKVKAGLKNIPCIVNKKIHIGFLHDFLEVKGGEYTVKLFEKYKTFRDYDIEYLVVNKNIKPYKEEEYYDYVKKLNLHCLLFLSKWGETWSYSLTKALNTGLPILYNNFGSFKERIPVREHYFKVHEEEKEVENHEKLYEVFEKLLEYIIENNGKMGEMNEEMRIEYQDFYKRLLDQ